MLVAVFRYKALFINLHISPYCKIAYLTAIFFVQIKASECKIKLGNKYFWIQHIKIMLKRLITNFC